MKKIPTLFLRDWDGDRSLVTRNHNPQCDWVFRGEGRPTIKLDGTCVMVRNGYRFKRCEARGMVPAYFEEVEFDPETGKRVGWVPVGPGPEDRWHREAIGGLEDGTYELIGPRIQGNPENRPQHELIRHGSWEVTGPVPLLDFDGLKAFLIWQNREGLVFHHRNPNDGRMAKIKLRDFGLKRMPVNETA